MLLFTEKILLITEYILITEKLVKSPQFRVCLQHKCFSDVVTNYSVLQKLLAQIMDVKSISPDFIHMPREALRTEVVVSAKQFLQILLASLRKNSLLYQHKLDLCQRCRRIKP